MGEERWRETGKRSRFTANWFVFDRLPGPKSCGVFFEVNPNSEVAIVGRFCDVSKCVPAYVSDLTVSLDCLCDVPFFSVFQPIGAADLVSFCEARYQRHLFFG